MVPTSRVFCFVEPDPRNIATTHLILHISIMCRSGRHRAEKQTKLTKCFVSLLHNLSTQLHVITICAELLILFKSSWMTKLSNWSTQVVLLNKININDKRGFRKLMKTAWRPLPTSCQYYYPCIEALHFLWSLAQMLSKQGNFLKKHPETWKNRTCQNARVGRLLHCCVLNRLLMSLAGLRNRPFTNINQRADLSGSISTSTLWSFSVISSVEIVELEWSHHLLPSPQFERIRETKSLVLP